MTAASHRLVLKEHTGVMDVQRAADELGWDSLGMLDRDPARRVYTELAWEAEGGVTVHYVEDESAEERYLITEGGTAAARADILDRIGDAVDVWSLDDLMFEVSSARHSSARARAVKRLGVASPLTAVDAIVVRIARAATDPDPRVRRAAVWAMACAGWPEYADALVFAAADRDPGIARAAAAVHGRLREAA